MVESVFDETLGAPVKVYNFEVEGLHTYYVGGSVQVLVHNTCGGQPPAPSHVGGDSYGNQLALPPAPERLALPPARSAAGTGAANTASKPITVEELLSNKTLTSSTPRLDNYTSPVKGHGVALNEFNSLGLTNVRAATGKQTTILGELPDGRIVNVRSISSKGYPTLEFPDLVADKK